MKVLVVLGISLLVAVSAATNLPEGRDYCCGQHVKDMKPSAWKENCFSLVEMTDILIQETDKLIEDTKDVEMTPELRIQIKINSFTTATIRCVRNNAVYRNIHIMLDNLHNIIANYPTPKNALKNITEAEAMLEKELASVQEAQSDAGPKLDQKIRTRVEEFTKESMEKAVKVFERNLEQAQSNAKIFESIGLNEVIDKIVEGIHKCLSIKQTDFAANFKCRENLNVVASDLQDKIRNLRIMGQIKHVEPDQSIRSLLVGITDGAQGLKDAIMNDKLQREFVDGYKGFLP